MTHKSLNVRFLFHLTKKIYADCGLEKYLVLEESAKRCKKLKKIIKQFFEIYLARSVGIRKVNVTEFLKLNPHIY